ncbi:hypothetical protein O0R52_22230 (plasmid) [Bacillus halotolerans]|uniref:Uncharacterized protein n=1 Tax=Bacillus halotolerans TaxID=260554 RepID=A0ABY7I722_9BACI|nr:hypothetical protein [Bacillus halotolerans]WAT23502.1 hypothetical protein O0R52_22230 [Bacillus halotolerans]
MRERLSWKNATLRFFALITIMLITQIIDLGLGQLINNYHHEFYVSGGFIIGFIYRKWIEEDIE